MENPEFDPKDYENAFNQSYDEKHEEFEKITNQKLIISLIGSVNAGKSSTINALTGKNYTEVKARAGWTKDVSIYELSKGVYIADTPGLFDIDSDVSKKASDFVENTADIILYFINAASGMTAHEKKAFQEIDKLGKPVILVLNKIDALDPNERVDVLNQIREEVGYSAIAISSKTGEGVQQLHSEIAKTLETIGKELLFLKVSKYKEQSVKKLINIATAAAAAVGALPIPGADIVALTGIQTTLALKIAYIYDFEPSKQDVMKIVASTVTGSVGKQISRWAITALKAAGWIPGAQFVEIATMAVASAVAASMTFAFGWACNKYYQSGMEINLDDLSKMFDNLYKKHKAENEVQKV